MLVMIERRLHGLGLVALASMFLFIMVSNHGDDQQQHFRGSNTTTAAPTPATMLLTTLCADKCETDCRHYHTPFQHCFNGRRLYPDDPSWNSTDDMLDTPINATHFRRNFYSRNSSCQGDPTDGFVLPYQECVGPFGAPRPWGSFQPLSVE